MSVETSDLLDKPYSEIHFAEIIVECVVSNADDDEGVHRSGRIVGRHRGDKVKYDSQKANNYVGSNRDVITIRWGDNWKDLRMAEWDVVEFEPCDDPEAVKEAWSE